MFNFKKINCNHDYLFLDKYQPDMMFPFLEKTEKYIFKCNKCGQIKTTDNYEVIEKIQKIFENLLNDELKKPQKERLSNEDFISKVWSKYSEYSTINNHLRYAININPVKIYKELSKVNENEILSLNFIVSGARITTDIINKSMDGNWHYIIAKNKKGKYITVNEIRFKINVEAEERRLKGRYLRKGMKEQYDVLKNEAISNVSKTYKILYNPMALT